MNGSSPHLREPRPVPSTDQIGPTQPTKDQDSNNNHHIQMQGDGGHSKRARAPQARDPSSEGAGEMDVRQGEGEERAAALTGLAGARTEARRSGSSRSM